MDARIAVSLAIAFFAAVFIVSFVARWWAARKRKG